MTRPLALGPSRQEQNRPVRGWAQTRLDLGPRRPCPGGKNAAPAPLPSQPPSPRQLPIRGNQTHKSQHSPHPSARGLEERGPEGQAFLAASSLLLSGPRWAGGRTAGRRSTTSAQPLQCAPGHWGPQVSLNSCNGAGEKWGGQGAGASISLSLSGELCTAPGAQATPRALAVVLNPQGEAPGG